MWCSSSSRTARRRLCLALAAWPLVGTAPARAAATDAAGPEAALAALQRWGSGEFRRFGFLVYEATLWAGAAEPTRPPLALQLTYRRRIDGRDIAQASIDQMRRFDADESRLRHWGDQLTRLFPDVRPGDRILGLHLPNQARFFHNDRPLGVVEGAAFAATFFAIWLDPRTSEPGLRAALLSKAGN